MVEQAFDGLKPHCDRGALAREGQFDFELAQCDELREPAMQVTVRFLDQWHHAELYARRTVCRTSRARFQRTPTRPSPAPDLGFCAGGDVLWWPAISR